MNTSREPLPDSSYSAEQPYQSLQTGEKTKKIRTISVDPLVGATVRIEVSGQSPIEVHQDWGVVPVLIVKETSLETRPTAVSEQTDVQLGSINYAALLNSPRQFEASVTPLPINRGDTSDRGTRGFRALVTTNPGRVVCFSGLGVVQTDSEEGQQPEIIVNPPRGHETVDQYINVGTRTVDAQGHIWSERNQSPFGAYDKDGLETKVARTKQLGQNFGLRLLDHGYYAGTDMGWMVYDLPADVITACEALALELKLPREYQGRLYGQAVEQLFRQLRNLHDRDIVHYQLHPGNWFVRFTQDGQAQVILTDWETATELTQMPPSSAFDNENAFTRLGKTEAIFEGLSPQQKAKALDLYNALSSTALIQTGSFLRLVSGQSNNLSVDCKWLYTTRESLDYQLLTLAHGLTAYLQGDVSDEATIAVQRSLTTQLAPIAFKLAEMNKLYSGNDLTYLANGSDGGEFVISRAMNELKLRLAKLCTSITPQEFFQNLMSGGSALQMSELLIAY